MFLRPDKVLCNVHSSPRCWLRGWTSPTWRGSTTPTGWTTPSPRYRIRPRKSAGSMTSPNPTLRAVRGAYCDLLSMFSLFWILTRDIERSPIPLVLQTPSKSFRHFILITKGGVRGDVGIESMSRIWKSLNIFISKYVNLNSFRANRYE